MKTEKIKVSFDVPVAEYKKTKNGLSGPMLLQISWALKNIALTLKSHIKDGYPHEDVDYLLEEYAKYYLMNLAGIETYPITRPYKKK